MVRSMIASTLGLVCLAGCVGAVSGAGRPRVTVAASARPASPAATPLPMKASPPPGAFTSGLAPAGAGIISNNGAGLGGVVSAPVGLIANNGGTIISNNGGGIVSNAGAGYRTLALEQAPLAEAEVHLMDAYGRPVLGRDGQPLVTRADAKGRYRFEGTPPARNLVLVVKLAGNKGELRAIVPGAASQAVDIELISTLTTGYILGTYCRTQPDPQATLDKLPGDVEGETRRRADAALAAAGGASPSDLSEAKVIEAVEQLRQRDTALNAQMETVKKLLIAAGQSDLGTGRPATEVSLSAVDQLLLAPDGGLYISEGRAGRVWKLTVDGRLVTVAGSGTRQTGSLDGKLAAEAGLYNRIGLSFDHEGRLLLAETYDRRLTRLETDGRLKSLASGTFAPSVAVSDTQGVLHVISAPQPVGVAAEYWTIAPGKAPAKIHTFTPSEREILYANQSTYGIDAKGRLCFAGLRTAYRFDPATKQLTPMALGSPSLTAIDASGHCFYIETSGTPSRRSLKVLKADGTTLTLLSNQSTLSFNDGVALAPDGTAYYADNQNRIHRLSGPTDTIVAGTLGAVNAGSVSFGEPAGQAFLPDGGMVVADKTKNQIILVTGEGDGQALVGTGEGGIPAAGQTATAARISNPRALQADGQGVIYFIDQDAAVWRVGADGKLASWLPKQAGQLVTDLLVAPDGTTYVSVYDTKVEGKAQVLRRRATETAFAPLAEEKTDNGHMTRPGMALAPDGTLHWIITQGGKGRLKRWTAAGGVTEIKVDSRFMAQHMSNGSLAVDGRGRFIVTLTATHVIWRYDPVKNDFEQLAGRGGRFFSGTGVDDAVSLPRYPAFDAAGNLYFSDGGHKQVKRIPVGDLR